METLFFYPGTTVELLASQINKENLRIITNCLPVFNILSERKPINFKLSY